MVVYDKHLCLSSPFCFPPPCIMINSPLKAWEALVKGLDNGLIELVVYLVSNDVIVGGAAVPTISVTPLYLQVIAK